MSISPVACKMYDRESILKEYTQEQLGVFSVGKDDTDYLVFTIDIKNNAQEAVSINRLITFFSIVQNLMGTVIHWKNEY